MNKIKAFAIAIVAVASVGAFAQNPKTNKAEGVSASAPYLYPTVYAAGGNAQVSNPNAAPVVVDYLITVMHPNGMTRIFSRRAIVAAYSTYTDFAEGFNVIDSGIVSWRFAY
jgi:hypothetical protein